MMARLSQIAMRCPVASVYHNVGTFADGSFGFYNYSQERVRYSALEQSVAPPPTGTVPEPASLALVGLGLLAAVGAGKRRKA